MNNQYFTPSLKIKKSQLYDQLKLKSMTIDPRKTFNLDIQRTKSIKRQPRMELPELKVFGQGKFPNSNTKRRTQSMYSTFWQSLYTARVKKSEIPLLTIKGLQ
ncbi:hypothetical protein pb186bvf_016622 [Paramecium bursaria]